MSAESLNDRQHTTLLNDIAAAAVVMQKLLQQLTPLERIGSNAITLLFLTGVHEISFRVQAAFRHAGSQPAP